MANENESEGLLQTNGDVYPPFYQRMGSLPPFVREGDVEYPFEDTSGVGDENKIRGNWGSRLDFILSALGFSVGLGNLWRFPYYLYVNGGAAFLIPYVLMIVFVGVPLFMLEAAMGQFASLGCVSVWKVCPMFKGVGVGMFIISCIVAIYYNMLTAWSVYYLVSSVRTSLPWASCNNEWNTPDCLTSRTLDNNCVHMNDSHLRNASACVSAVFSSESNFSADLLALAFRPNRTLPSHEFFYRQVVMRSSGVDDMGTIHWQLALYLLVAWVLVFFALFKGIKTSGKVVYVTATLPYVILLVLFVRALTLKGSVDGLIFFLTPQWEKLLEGKTWGDAAAQVFFSLGCGWGAIITLSSYNRFHNNCYRDVWIVCIGDVLSSCFSCLVVFATIGFMAEQLQQNLESFLFNDAGLAFVVFAEALALLPVAPLWAFIFFIMLIMLAIDTEVAVVEAIVAAICDEFPERLRRNHRHVLSLFALIFYAIGVALCTQAGIYMVEMLDYFAVTWSVLLIGFFEVMAFAWVYGVDNVLDNIKWMIRFYPPYYVYWKTIWKIWTPLCLLVIIIYTWIDYRPRVYRDYVFPFWANLIGWGISVLPVLAIPVTAFVQLCLAKGSCITRVQTLMSPEDDWGPALAVHRAEQYPLQILEARRPFKTANGEEEGDEVRERSVSDSASPAPMSLPHFDRETAI